MPEYEEYIGLDDDKVPDHEYQKSHGDGYARGYCNACARPKESRWHKEPEPA